MSQETDTTRTTIEPRPFVKMHGLGKYTFADGEVHPSGEWVNGNPKK